MTQEALKLALEFIENSECGTADLEARIKEALAQTEREYERGFIDGMQKQMQSSVDKAVNRMAQPEQLHASEDVSIGVDVTEDGAHVTALRSYRNGAKVVFYSQFHSAPQRTEQEPVAHSVIAGVLFDFMGWLTSRKERIVLSSADNASPAADAIRDFANMRGLSLDDAKVLDWNNTPPQLTEQPAQRTWVGLAAEDRLTAKYMQGAPDGIEAVIDYIEAKLKDKNT